MRKGMSRIAPLFSTIKIILPSLLLLTQSTDVVNTPAREKFWIHATRV